MANNNLSLKDLDAFKGLSESVIKMITNSSKLYEVNLGDLISNKNVISNQICLIAKGSARLIGTTKDSEYTVCKLGVGNFIGLTSLIRSDACEEIIASENSQILAFPDSTIISLYQEEEYFRNWCDTNLFPGELQSYVENIASKESLNKDKSNQLFAQLIQKAKIKTIKEAKEINSSEKQINIASSANIKDIGVWSTINNDQKIEFSPPFNARIIILPNEISLNSSSPKKTINYNLNTENKDLSKSYSIKESDEELGKYQKIEKIKLIEANGDFNIALASLQMLANIMNLPFRKDSLEKNLRDNTKEGKSPTFEVLGSIISAMGLHASGGKLDAKMATRLPCPSIIKWKSSIALLTNSNPREIQITSPSDGFITIQSKDLPERFKDGIEAIIVEKSNLTPEKKFGFEWFLPIIKKYRGTLSLVFVASFVVQLFGLANPLLIQVIIDKVISQRSLDTLQILGVALVVVTLLGGILGSLRTFLFAETTNRIDIRLASEVIDHLLKLPLNYFDKRPVGELGTRIAELEKIREFLTGQALTTVLDAAFSLIYIVVMLLYSWLLTFIALIVVPLQIVIVLIGTPLIRRQISVSARENAKTQSHLVEVLTGIQTIKAQNVETVSRWKWQDYYKGYINKTFEKTITGTAISQTSTVLQQLSQLLVLWVGASLVLSGKLTLGQLIAFRIISSYVTQPLLRLSSIWQNIQELRVSFERLGDIVDYQEESNESDKKNIPLPTIQGNVNFENIHFRFRNNSPNILENINIKIDAGSFVGIVGQSGSGKSSLMKLLPRLYEPQIGKIKIDDYDISKIELYSLRRQIGIVPQDPLLFAGTVSENIALTDPDATNDEIVNAAKIAEAHEFIMTLPNGYSTHIGERGSGLSGGQKQRIAIARTILSKPRMLILDEATSALDYLTERNVCNSLKDYYKNSTVFFITHRLSTIKNSDIILMLSDGVLDEVGNHKELMERKGRYYALYQQQEST